MKVLKILTDRRVATAIVSAVSAIVCAVCAGCKLACGKFAISDFSAEIYPVSTNSVETVME